MSVIIFNPNERKDPISGKSIEEFTSMEKHVNYIWDNVVKQFSPAKKIYIVAHSMGGYCTVDMLSKNSNK